MAVKYRKEGDNMVLCEHCIAYLSSCGEAMMIPSNPSWVSGEDEEMDKELKCDWCGDTLEDKTYLYDVEFR